MEDAPELSPLLRPVNAYLSAALSGVLYFFAFPGLDLWPLAFVAQVPLVLALRGQPARRAVTIGLVAGFTSSATICYWLFTTIQVFGGFSLPLSAVVMVALCLYTGGRTALCAWLHARASLRGWPGGPVFVLAFITSELVYPFLFPWYFGVTVHEAPPLFQVGDLGGPYLVGAVLLVANVAIAEVVMARIEARPVSRGLVAAGFAIPLLSAAYGLFRIASVTARASASQTIRIGIAQGNMPLVGRRESIATSTRLTRALKDRGAELVVWSESTVPDTFPEASYRDDVREQITRRLGVPTIFGTAVKGPGAGHDREFNTALLADTEGTIIGRYDKQFLLPFGEYIPFGEAFPSVYAWSANTGRLTPGESLEPFLLDGHRITALICYEDTIPGFVNRLVAHAKPDLLVNLTIDTWFGHTVEPWQHLALATMRAVEHRRYLVRATNSGVSAIIDAVGRPVVHGGTFKEEAIVGEARFMTGTTVYEVIGNAPFYAGALASAVMAFVRRRGRQRLEIDDIRPVKKK